MLLHKLSSGCEPSVCLAWEILQIHPWICPVRESVFLLGIRMNCFEGALSNSHRILKKFVSCAWDWAEAEKTYNIRYLLISFSVNDSFNNLEPSRVLYVPGFCVKRLIPVHIFAFPLLQNLGLQHGARTLPELGEKCTQTIGYVFSAFRGSLCVKISSVRFLCWKWRILNEMSLFLPPNIFRSGSISAMKFIRLERNKHFLLEYGTSWLHNANREDAPDICN